MSMVIIREYNKAHELFIPSASELGILGCFEKCNDAIEKC